MRQGVNQRSLQSVNEFIAYTTAVPRFGRPLSGLEPPTSPLSGVRSNHLSYKLLHTGISARSSSDNLCEHSHNTYLLGKEVIQPQVPLRLPCYDFTPVMNHKVVSALPKVSYLLLLQPTPMV